MPWKKGASGNPKGNPGKDKLFRTALLMELKSKGQDMPELRQIARKCIDLALGGEPWAVKEIADRLDGKASVVVADEKEIGARKNCQTMSSQPSSQNAANSLRRMT